MRGTVVRPPGFLYVDGVLAVETQAELIGFLKAVEFEAVTIRGNTARRTVRHYGRRYDYGSRTLRTVDPLPQFLEPLRDRAEELAGLAPGAIVEALVNYYPADAAIGWHTDAHVYRTVVGFSLGATARMQFRSGPSGSREVFEQPLAAGSAYVMQGPSVSDWQHRVTEAEDDRFSVTYRSHETSY